jgi:hypothetical protein
MKRRHEFLASTAAEVPDLYCAVCSLPRGNGIHRARPRSFMVIETIISLDPTCEEHHYGPFGTEADAQEFAGKMRGPHRLATVAELSDPAQVITK